MPTATTSTWAELPASRATVGHHDHKAAVRTSRPSRPSPNNSSTVVSTAANAVHAWIGVVDVIAGGEIVHGQEVRLGHRRVDGRHARPVDQRAPRHHVRRSVRTNEGPRQAVVGAAMPQERIPQPGQLRRRGHVRVRVDARRLHLAVPDVPVQVVALPRRRGHRGDLDADAAQQDQSHRQPHGHLPQQEGRGQEHDPPEGDERQRPDVRRVQARPDHQQHQPGQRQKQKADRRHPQPGVHSASISDSVGSVGGSSAGSETRLIEANQRPSTVQVSTSPRPASRATSSM